MVVRSLLLFLSRQPHLRRWVENSPVAQKRTRRFVAGKTLEEGLAVCARLNSEGIAATLIEGGIRLIEVTLAVPGATDLVQTLALARGEENR